MDAGWLRRAIATKRDGGTLDASLWARIVAGYVGGTVDEAPMAALAMACTIRGMSDDEILALTDAMVASGDVLEFADRATIVDKHSSGGVGDTVSLVVVPLVAAAGIRVAKLSGRALGHTGGTLDKLEAIPGVRTDLSPLAFAAQIERIGCAVAAQSDRLVPADRMLYALRDRTGSVPSIGLIAASIVSKKLAGGAGGIVFDVKVGAGAFMRTPAEAIVLASTMVRLAERSGRRASAIVTDMDEPLAPAVGTGIEALAARDFLRGVGGRGASRFAQVTGIVAQEMLRVGGVPAPELGGRVERAFGDGSAYERLVALVEAQGGSRAALEALAPLPRRTVVAAGAAGYVGGIDAVSIGETARDLVERHGSRAGVRIVAPVGSRVECGAALALIEGPSAGRSAGTVAEVAAAFRLVDAPPAPRPLVLDIVRDASFAAEANQ